MPLENFDGNTWVAFSDLCGTKAMYRESPEKAAEALNCFYSTVYELHDQAVEISGLVVSDNAIFWVHGDRDNVQPEALDRLLALLKQLHQRMAQAGYLVSTSIAWGHFAYQQRLELRDLRKDRIIGGAYMDAYAKNKDLIPGSIRIISHPEDTWSDTFCPQAAPLLRDEPQGFRKSFIWWVDSPEQVEQADRSQQAANESRFQALLGEYRNTRSRGTRRERAHG